MAFAAAACIALAGYNNLAGVHPWHRRWYPAVNALAATATLAAAAASGLTADDLGLRRDRLRSGLRLGSMAAAPVAAACGLAALTPATRPLLNDQRVAGLDRRQLTYHVLLRIPLGTVAWEEAAFRGVLQAALVDLVLRIPWQELDPSPEAGLVVAPGPNRVLGIVHALTADVAALHDASAAFLHHFPD